MPILTINTLGGISITYGDKIFEDKLSQKSQAIICFLLSAHDMRARKTKLSALFWADSDPVAAKSNLRFNLWNIRKIIGSDQYGEELILSDREYVRLNPAYQFESDITFIKAFNKNQITGKDLIHFKDYFKGEYLEGFYLSGCDEYSDTILVERMACQNIRMDILEAIYDYSLQAGDLRGCIRTMSEALLLDPFNETYAYRALGHMASLNQIPQAIGFYQDFAVRLRRNLNIAPSAEVQALHKKLLMMQHQAPSLDIDTPVEDVLRSEDILDIPRAIVICCVPDIPYYWMAECIDNINALYGDEMLRRLPLEVILDLACIYPKFDRQKTRSYKGENSFRRNISQSGVFRPPSIEIFDIRLYYAFREFLECVADPGGLEIITENAAEMDDASAAFIKFISHKPLPSVKFMTKEYSL